MEDSDVSCLCIYCVTEVELQLDPGSWLCRVIRVIQIRFFLSLLLVFVLVFSS